MIFIHASIIILGDAIVSLYRISISRIPIYSYSKQRLVVKKHIIIYSKTGSDHEAVPKLQRTFIQRPEDSLLGGKFGKGSFFSNSTFLQDNDLVRIFDRRETVRYNDRCPPFLGVLECLLHQLFALVVECAGCFVQEQDLSVLWRPEDGPCNRNPLACDVIGISLCIIVNQHKRGNMLPTREEP